MGAYLGGLSRSDPVILSVGAAAAQAKLDGASARIGAIASAIDRLQMGMATIQQAIAALQQELGGLVAPNPEQYYTTQQQPEGKPPNVRMVSVRVFNSAAYNAAQSTYLNAVARIQTEITAKQNELAQKEAALAGKEEELAKAQHDLAQAQSELLPALAGDAKATQQAQDHFAQEQADIKRLEEQCLMAQADAEKAQEALQQAQEQTQTIADGAAALAAKQPPRNADLQAFYSQAQKAQASAAAAVQEAADYLPRLANGELRPAALQLSAHDFVELAPHIASFESGVHAQDLAVAQEIDANTGGGVSLAAIAQMTEVWQAAGFTDEQINQAIGQLQPLLPADPRDLPKLFPELQGKSDAELKAVYASLVKLRDGDVSDKLAAVSELEKSLKTPLDKVVKLLDPKHNATVLAVASDPKAIAAVATLVDGKASVADKVTAALTLATEVEKALAAKKPDGTTDPSDANDLDAVLKKALGPAPAALKLAEAIEKFADPQASAFDKTKAAFELADAIKDYAPSVAPTLAKSLGDLDSSFKIVSSALVLLDPKASLQDKALAAAQIAVEVPDVGGDLAKFADFLKTVGVQDSDAVIAEVSKLSAAGLAGLSPELASQLTPKQLEALKAAVADPASGKALTKLLDKFTDPAQIDAVLAQLGKTTDGAKRTALIDTLAKLDDDAFKKLLTKTVDGAPLLERLAAVVEKLSPEGRESLGKLLAHFDIEGLELFTEVADKVDGRALDGVLKALDKIDSKLAGKALCALLKVLDKLGVKLTEETAIKVLEGLGKMVPVAGALVSGIDVVRFNLEAMDTSLPPDLRMFAAVTANVNGLDTALGIIEATEIGNVDLPVQIGLGVAEIAMSLAFDAEKAKFEADPKNYQAPDWMRAVNLVGAAAMGPSGMVMLVAIYGPEGAAKLIQDGVKAGLKGAIELARMAGISQAEMTGDTLKLSGALLHELADVVRHPEKYGEQVKELALAAADQFNKVIAAGGQLAEQARQELATAVEAAKQAGEQGLEVLRFIAQNPGEAGKIAVAGIESLISTGIDLTTAAGKALYKKAVDTLADLEAGWRTLTGAAAQAATALIDSTAKFVDASLERALALGGQSVELVAWVATHPGEIAARAGQELGALVREGGAVAQQAWDAITALGEHGYQLAQDTIRALAGAGEAAIDTLTYIVDHPGQAAAAVEQWVGQTLNDLARQGGELAQKAAATVKKYIDEGAPWAISTGIELFQDGVQAFADVAKSWKDNLTEGGKAFVSGLADLGDAGVESLERLAGFGGQLTQAAVDHLSDLVRQGSQLAGAALTALANIPGAIADCAGRAINSLGSLIPQVHVSIPGTPISFTI